MSAITGDRRGKLWVATSGRGRNRFDPRTERAQVKKTLELERIGLFERAKVRTQIARDFIWALNPEKDSLYETCLHLQEFGNALFNETEVNFHAQGLSAELSRVQLDMEWKHHLTLLFKEGMNNALKHARCQNVALAIVVQRGILQMSLVDDGVGLAHLNGHARNGNGTGMENMKHRAHTLHGQSEIQSLEGQGTMILFSSAISRHGYGDI